jgi:hypothetical protein
MKFIKKGQILSPALLKFGEYRLMCPTPLLLDDRIRIFCGFCNNDGISKPGFIDVNICDPSDVIFISQDAILDIGEDGMFDDNGICPTSIIRIDNKLLMYYFGFQLGVKLPFYMFSGRAESIDDGISWSRTQKTPVIDRSPNEPIMRSGPNVIYEDNKYKVYYPCGYKLISINNKQVHTYQIHYMESIDGINWPKSGIPVIKFQNHDEYGFGRPFVFKLSGRYYMLYSIRTKSLGYRLGYAISENGVKWDRLDNIEGLELGADGTWDSEMLCYSSFLKTKDKSYLFYNGNNLGATGFGFAELIEE